jgi:hypothetical protein
MAVIPSLRMRSQELCALPLFAGVHIHSANHPPSASPGSRRSITLELGPTRDAVLEAGRAATGPVAQARRGGVQVKDQHETNRSVWGYVQGLTRLSQRTPWPDARFALDEAAKRLLATVH